MTKLIQLQAGVPVVSTLDVWQGLGVEHTAIIKLIKKYKIEFDAIRTFSFLNAKSTGGRPSEFCFLDEEQATFLITLMRNSSIIVPFKFKLSREFYRMKNELMRLASQKQNAEYLETRNAGKETRMIATDAIKTFVDYATSQGSQSANMYYMTISKMENAALFLLDQKYPNLRDILDIHQLSTVKCADRIVIKALDDGMEGGLNYKDIYKLAKLRIESFAEVIGKTLIINPQMKLT